MGAVVPMLGRGDAVKLPDGWERDGDFWGCSQYRRGPHIVRRTMAGGWCWDLWRGHVAAETRVSSHRTLRDAIAAAEREVGDG